MRDPNERLGWRTQTVFCVIETELEPRPGFQSVRVKRIFDNHDEASLWAARQPDVVPCGCASELCYARFRVSWSVEARHAEIQNQSEGFWKGETRAHDYRGIFVMHAEQAERERCAANSHAKHHDSLEVDALKTKISLLEQALACSIRHLREIAKITKEAIGP